MQSKFLQYHFSVARELLVLVVRLIGPCELHQFNFLKLVLADDPAHVFAIRPGLAAEARRITGNGERQPRGVNHLIAKEIGQRHLGRGNQPEIVIIDLEKIVGELRELPGAVH